MAAPLKRSKPSGPRTTFRVLPIREARRGQGIRPGRTSFLVQAPKRWFLLATSVLTLALGSQECFSREPVSDGLPNASAPAAGPRETPVPPPAVHDGSPSASEVMASFESSLFVIACGGDCIGSAHFSMSAVLGESASGNTSSASYSSGSGFWAAATVDSPGVVDVPVRPSDESTLPPEGMKILGGSGRGLGIQFALHAAGRIRLEIYDVLGRSLYRLVQSYESGVHAVYWDGIEGRGPSPAAGVYFVRLQTEKSSYSAKAIWLR